MSKVVRISDDAFTRLQKLAEPLVDTPSSVIDKLLDEHESSLAKNKTNEPMKSYNTKLNPNLFLVPADETNIKQSIQKKVKFNNAAKFLSNSEEEKLEAVLDETNEFNCWAMTESNRSTFRSMKKGDCVLLSEKGTGKFNFTGTVKGKFESKALGNNLWSFTPGKPWSLIYILGDLRVLNINKQEMVKTLGYKANYHVPGVIRVQKENLACALSEYEDIDLMLNALNKK